MENGKWKTDASHGHAGFPETFWATLRRSHSQKRKQTEVRHFSECPTTRELGYNCKPGRTLVRSSAMKFQVALQWPASSVDDFDGMVEIHCCPN
jgi:hypothetical protein